MSRKPVLIQLSDELISQLDEVVEEQGRSRSAIVRDAVERYVATESIAAKDRRLIEAYARVPDDGEWADWAEAGLRDLLEEESW